jgi:hypothetical protein
LQAGFGDKPGVAMPAQEIAIKASFDMEYRNG